MSDNMSVQQKILYAQAALYEKYGLPQVPKTSWKDLCLIEMRSMGIQVQEKSTRYPQKAQKIQRVELV